MLSEESEFDPIPAKESDRVTAFLSQTTHGPLEDRAFT